jgi:hypothetical protein
MQTIADARLVCDLPAKFNVTLAISDKPETQLFLHRRECHCAAQALMKRTNVRQKLGQLACDYRR